MSHPEPSALELHGVSKSFEAVRALVDVSVSVRAGEVIGLIGENGAGKSTLLRVLSGDHTPDSGELRLKGTPRRFGSPREARSGGVRVIYQEPELAGPLTVAENLFLGTVSAAAGAGPFIRWSALFEAAAALIARYGFGTELAPHAVVDSLSPAQRQVLEIVKALRDEPAVLALDEPTSSLAEDEADRLLSTVERLRDMGVAVIYVSHRLREVRRVASRIVVLRDGRVVAQRDIAGDIAGGAAGDAANDDDELMRLMVGREKIDVAHTGPRSLGPQRLCVEGLSTRWLRDVSLTIRQGEILGVAGLVGAGRSELARALFGAVPTATGRVTVDGTAVRLSDPRTALDAGISMTPEDRHGEGLVLGRSVRENLTLAILRRLSRLGVIRKGRERRVARDLMTSLTVKAPSPEHAVSTLSGGNQQKVVLGRALSAQPKVLVLDEPTRGVDVGAKAEIYRLIHRQAELGMAILFISSELPELLAVADRIVVLAGGRVTGELSAAEATEHRVLALAMPDRVTS